MPTLPTLPTLNLAEYQAILAEIAQVEALLKTPHSTIADYLALSIQLVGLYNQAAQIINNGAAVGVTAEQIAAAHQAVETAHAANQQIPAPFVGSAPPPPPPPPPVDPTSIEYATEAEAQTRVSPAYPHVVQLTTDGKFVIWPNLGPFPGTVVYTLPGA